MLSKHLPLAACTDEALAYEDLRFENLQNELAAQFQEVFPFSAIPRTIVVIPSLSMDASELAKISGVHHYEERLLCLLMLLRMPRTRIVYVTSQPIHPAIIDYYLHLLPGIPGGHARDRLILLSCHDSSSKPLTQKILERPRLMERIRNHVVHSKAAHMTCFNSTNLERALAISLNTPLYATDPTLSFWGSKSGSRQIFKEAGISLPAGFEDLRDERDIVDALAHLKRSNPSLKRAVIKLNEGFSGEGNAVFSFAECPDSKEVATWIEAELPHRIKFEAPSENWERYREKFAEMRGIVESFIEGNPKRSPSAQCRINPIGDRFPISTHDQVLSGPSGQVFHGATFPADEAYRLEVQELGMRVADQLKERGAIGRFGVDFISVREMESWKHYAIEINLRKGGTTHPFIMLDFLADGSYEPETGLYRTPAGHPRYYYSTDNLQSDHYKGLTPDDLIDIAVSSNLHFHSSSQQGVVFHLIGALSEFGKLGVVCIGGSYEEAEGWYDQTVSVLEKETGNDS